MTKNNRTAGLIKASIVSICQALSAFQALPATAGEYDRLAYPLARAARAHSRKRLAVLPFEVIGAKRAAGKIVSERLVTSLMADGGVDVVERSLLEAVVREQRLQVSGLVDSRSVRELGRILDVDALVMGTVTALKNDRLEVNARLIDAETAKVLGATSLKVEKDFEEPFFDEEAWKGFPKIDFAAPAAAGGWERLGDGEESDCRHARADEDAMERAALDLKARFWATKLREGLDANALIRNPGSEIRNEAIRSDFYARLNRYHHAVVAPLSQSERERLSLILTQLKKLQRECGGEER